MDLHILTASYRHDFELFQQLHQSVCRFTTDDVRHEVVVPRRDVGLFRTISSDRLVVTDEDTLLPRSFRRVDSVTRSISKVPRLDKVAKIQAVNIRRPWPPVRNWILQQLIKLEAAARSTADVVLVVDSDVVLLQQLDPAELIRDGVVRFYALPEGVAVGMADHQVWHDTSRELLGLSAEQADVRSDYIAGFVTWDPEIVRSTLERVSSHAGRRWLDVIGSRMKFSEYTLYGTFVDHVASIHDRNFTSADTRCASHWDPVALDSHSSTGLVERVRPTDLAILIQSTSNTPTTLRSETIEAAVSKVHSF